MQLFFSTVKAKQTSLMSSRIMCFRIWKILDVLVPKSKIIFEESPRILLLSSKTNHKLVALPSSQVLKDFTTYYMAQYFCLKCVYRSSLDNLQRSLSIR